MLGNVRKFLGRVRADEPGTVPTASVYRIKHEKCGNQADGRGEQSAYRHWMDAFARGVGRTPMVLFYEFDSLVSVRCLSHHGLDARIAELRDGIKKLSALPHTVVYIDAGAADALSVRTVARLLNRVGIRSIQGFFVNSTHFDWTSSEVAYGQKVLRLVHGKHFVVSTAVNGQGPLRPRNRVRDGNEVLCNPSGRGSGRARPRRPRATWPTAFCGSAIRVSRAAGATQATRAMANSTYATRWGLSTEPTSGWDPMTGASGPACGGASGSPPPRVALARHSPGRLQTAKGVSRRGRSASLRRRARRLPSAAAPGSPA